MKQSTYADCLPDPTLTTIWLNWLNCQVLSDASLLQEDDTNLPIRCWPHHCSSGRRKNTWIFCHNWNARLPWIFLGENPLSVPIMPMKTQPVIQYIGYLLWEISWTVLWMPRMMYRWEIEDTNIVHFMYTTAYVAFSLGLCQRQVQKLQVWI